MVTQYYGLYKSSMVQRSGCVHQLLTVPHDDIAFETRIWHKCPLCNDDHTFNYARCFTVSTASQKEAVQAWAKLNDVEIDFDIEQKS